MILSRDINLLIVDASAILDIEYIALKNMIEFEEQLREDGIQLYLANLNPEPYPLVIKSALGRSLGEKFMFLTMEQALEAYKQRQKSVECESQP